MAIYDYLVKKTNGEILSMETYRNQVLLIVNTANHCEFTYQYEDLQKIHEKYNTRGFSVLSFPCNQFANQNPEDAITTATQCKLQYGVTYPIFDKIEVNGQGTHPLYQYIKAQTKPLPMKRDTLQQKIMYDMIQQNFPDNLLGNNIRWNFTKFLVNQQGTIIRRFEPDDSFLEIEAAIEQLLVLHV
jgi:glutathione peroxidase